MQLARHEFQAWRRRAGWQQGCKSFFKGRAETCFAGLAQRAQFECDCVSRIKSTLPAICSKGEQGIPPRNSVPLWGPYSPMLVGVLSAGSLRWRAGVAYRLPVFPLICTSFAGVSASRSQSSGFHAGRFVLLFRMVTLRQRFRINGFLPSERYLSSY